MNLLFSRGLLTLEKENLLEEKFVSPLITIHSTREGKYVFLPIHVCILFPLYLYLYLSLSLSCNFMITVYEDNE